MGGSGCIVGGSQRRSRDEQMPIIYYQKRVKCRYRCGFSRSWRRRREVEEHETRCALRHLATEEERAKAGEYDGQEEI